MSDVQVLRDPFEVADPELERTLARHGEERLALPLETWVGRGLMLLAIVLVLWVDVRLAARTPTYGPAGEANTVAFAEQVAQHGTPPVLGKDWFQVAPTHLLPKRSVVLRYPESPVAGFAPSVFLGVTYPQAYALERPYPYYLVAPVSWIVPWRHRVAALRLLCVLCACLSIGFLWAAVREIWPANPLAAGFAAMVLGTMGGLMTAFAAFQPEALLLATWCAGLWLAARDWRQRRLSAWTVAAWTAATCVSSVALPAALGAVALLAIRSTKRAERARRVGTSVAVVLVPTIAWLLWNLHAYGNLWPVNAVAGAPPRAQDWWGLRTVLRPIFLVNRGIFDGLASSGLAPLLHENDRSTALLALALAIAQVVSLMTGRIAIARLALARAGAVLIGSFLSIYLTLFVTSIAAGGPVDYSATHFGGYAAAWAVVAAIGITTPFAHRRWLNLGIVAVLTLVLVSVFLGTPVA